MANAFPSIMCDTTGKEDGIFPSLNDIISQGAIHMANRSYLYSLSNRPTSYADRPETISGLSEWGYCVPLSFRILMSGDPMLCPSLVSDGFDEEPEDKKTKLYAISSDFETGFLRLKKFFTILNAAVGDKAPYLSEEIDDALAFLEAHRDSHLLLETIELDMMTAADESALKQSVNDELSRCFFTGIAVDALSDNIDEAVEQLRHAGEVSAGLELVPLSMLNLNADYDRSDDGCPAGVGYWSEHLFFGLWNRAEFEAAL
ncbi:DUF7822 domain-containing protein [Leminorella grimontii]|uniref:DUF7822 domain-containing protein n=1 Tax=Leminorella grimontii TaxID=82981 RepID=UPI002084A62F|nr:hypothetical protein [Leminorella grimontii]GKX58592.1 hypothetical protein SOASR031_09070 [Leminorella grimontii]